MSEELNPGRDLDALVAEKVMGWMTRGTGESISDPAEWVMPNGLRGREAPPFYSTDISAAWQVVEKMNRDGWCFRVASASPDNNYYEGYFVKGDKVSQVWLDTAPHAICVAALKAVELSRPTTHANLWNN